MLGLVNFISKSIFGRIGTVTNSDIAIFGNPCPGCELEIEFSDRRIEYLYCPPS